jgi:hypothetical protein
MRRFYQQPSLLALPFTTTMFEPFRSGARKDLCDQQVAAGATAIAVGGV